VVVTLCPDDFSKSGISAMNPGCKATADRSLISAAFAVLPAVMAKKASPNAIVAETLRMRVRFIVFSSDHRLRDARCQRAHTWRRCRGTRENDKGHFRIEIVPAGGTSAANYLEREIRHVLVLGAVPGQARLSLCEPTTAGVLGYFLRGSSAGLM